MATYMTSLKCGDKTYYLSYSGKDIYFDSSNKTGGTTLKGIKIYNNEMRNIDNKSVSNFDICQAIKNSLK